MEESVYRDYFKEYFYKKSWILHTFMARHYWYDWDFDCIIDTEWCTKLSPQQWLDTIYDWEKDWERPMYWESLAQMVQNKAWDEIHWVEEKLVRSNKQYVEYKTMPSDFCTKTMKPLNDCDCDLHWVEEKIEEVPEYKRWDFSESEWEHMQTHISYLSKQFNKLISFHNK
jgi:hypothetical protein